MKYAEVPKKLLIGHNAGARYPASDMLGNIRKTGSLYERVCKEVCGGNRGRRKKKNSKDFTLQPL